MVQVLSIGFILCDFQIIKQWRGIASHAVIGAEHLCGVGFAKTPRAADAAELISLADGLIDYADEAGFVDVCIVSLDAERFVSWIDIDAHVALHKSMPRGMPLGECAQIIA